MNTPCPGPGPAHTRSPGMYLCRPCWKKLPDAARTALNRRGPGAIRRYQALVEQLRAGTKLPDIEIPDE